MSRRGRLETKMAVLRAVESQRKVTWIMYEARLSYLALKGVLEELADGGLIRVVKPEEKDQRTEHHYELTQRGFTALERFNQLTKSLGED